ncbi:glycosyltransferase family 2 protein [Chloroflexus sp. Y-396-1]|uniref:glycosyltransferase family 2 protein n=1 Tax=Chloroflexus sp. Y-396-1 TaxID=867845 RepID=UPI00048D4B85|nr:glycosyltransferase family 2 protein [Chloroflexus sp. Y-396-1]
MQREVRLSIIIPCYNAATTLGEQLAALANQTWEQPWEVIVADNGSHDDSRRVAADFLMRMPHLRIVDAGARRGGAFARNEGARHARGTALAFVDADDVVAPGWVAAIGQALDRHPFVASRFDIERLNQHSWLSRTRRNPQADGLQRVSYPPYLPHAGGSGLAIERKLHEQVGGFDETLPRLMDTDYCFRVQLQCQVPLTFVPEALVYVRYRDTLRGMLRQTRERAIANVALARRYSEQQDKRNTSLSPWLSYARRWLRQVGRLTKIRQREQFAEWLRMNAWLIGLLQGSLQYRCPPLAI